MQTLPIADAELSAWLRLTRTRGISPATARHLLAAFGLPQDIFRQPYAAIAHSAGADAADALRRAPEAGFEASVAQAAEWAGTAGNYLVTLADPAYPPALLALADPPLVLYVKGRLELLHAPAIAIVGSRHATAQGLENAATFAHALATAGLVVVSGLALGIDGAAHRGALEARAGTVAVIGTGADLVYPRSHHALAHELAAHGAILSEWPLGTPARPAHFPQRNRLIAALVRGVLVVEAAAQSGSLITARLANEMGRDVFAIPGSIHAPLSKGCHRLIKDGAKLVEAAADVLHELRFEPYAATDAQRPAETAGRSGAQAAGACAPAETPVGDAQRVLEALGHDPAAIDVLAERTGLDGGALQAALLQLEMLEKITVLPGGRVGRLDRA